MRGLIMDFDKDPQVQNITDQFMFGDAFLVSPVTDYKATTRKLYLPAGTGWFNFYDGTYPEGGATIEAAAPLEKMPCLIFMKMKTRITIMNRESFRLFLSVMMMPMALSL